MAPGASTPRRLERLQRCQGAFRIAFRMHILWPGQRGRSRASPAAFAHLWPLPQLRIHWLRYAQFLFASLYRRRLQRLWPASCPMRRRPSATQYPT